MAYYKLYDNIDYPNRWYLGDISKVDNWLFTANNFDLEYSDLNSLEVDLYHDGVEMDFTITEGFAVPIVSTSFKNRMCLLKNIFYIPVSVRNVVLSQNYYVMIVNSFLDCVDEEKSEFEKFTSDDSIRPDLAGFYRTFFKLRIDHTKVKSESIFRIQKSVFDIIIREEVKNLLEGLSGVKFRALGRDVD